MTTTPAQPTCSESVFRTGEFHSRCGKKTTKTENGKPYCTVHVPSYVAAKLAKREAKWRANWAAKDQEQAALVEQARRAACYPALLEALEQAVEAAENFNRGDSLDHYWLKDAQDAIKKAKETL